MPQDAVPSRPRPATPTQDAILAALPPGGIRPVDLAGKLGMDFGRVCHALTTLRSRGLAHRTERGYFGDGRAVLWYRDGDQPSADVVAPLPGRFKQILDLFDDGEEHRVRDAAAGLQLDQGFCSMCISSMVAAGYLKARQNSPCRRTYRVTPLGRKALKTGLRE